jgi:chorismate mutase
MGLCCFLVWGWGVRLEEQRVINEKGVISVKSTQHLPILGSEDCGCCETNDRLKDESGKAYGCHERSTVFTRREEEILKRLRELGPKAKIIKEQIKLLEKAGSVDLEAKHRAMEELESLRQLRLQLDAERIAAAEERMRLLGHA